MAQKLNSKQQMITALTTEYPTFQIRSGSVTVSVPATGEHDIDVALTSNKFPNGVLWGQMSWGFPNLHWSHLPRSQQLPYQDATNLRVSIHVYNGGGAQQMNLYYVVFGY